MQTNALVDLEGFPLQAAIYWSCSSPCISVVHYEVSWWLFNAIWRILHAVACCFLFLLLLVLWTNFTSSSWVISSLAALAASRWTNWCRCCCYVPVSDAFDEVPIDQLNSDQLSLCWGICAAMICQCGMGEEDDSEKKWVVLKDI